MTTVGAQYYVTQTGYPQPQGPTTVVIQQQPGIRAPMDEYRSWSSGLCGCFDDFVSCFLVWFCPWCYHCYLFYRLQEKCCFFPAFCGFPFTLANLRNRYRGRHGIEGSICEDLCCVSCCYVCVACQLKRDMDYVKSQGYRP